jgi:predicted RNase H-like HicB family nuclease
MSNYRVLLSFDADKNVFVARAPELPHCTSEGATRAEAIAGLEDEMGATLANIKEQGGRAPVPVDADETLSGEISTKVSRGLHRELVWQARQEGVELQQLCAELLAAGVEARRERPGAGRRPQGAQGQQQGQGRHRGQDPRYQNIMEDKSTFMEYVRGLEQGQGQGKPGGSRRK